MDVHQLNVILIRFSDETGRFSLCLASYGRQNEVPKSVRHSIIRKQEEGHDQCKSLLWLSSLEFVLVRLYAKYAGMMFVYFYVVTVLNSVGLRKLELINSLKVCGRVYLSASYIITFSNAPDIFSTFTVLTSSGNWLL